MELDVMPVPLASIPQTPYHPHTEQVALHLSEAAFSPVLSGLVA